MTAHSAPPPAEFQPKIVGFLCYWCAYVAADAAGTARITQAPHLRIVRMNCSGMVDPSYVLKALAAGADGVLIAGCHPGDCHYGAGNLKAQRRFPLLKRLLAQLGVEDERVRMEWIAASEPAKLARVVNEMSDALRQLGPSPRPVAAERAIPPATVLSPALAADSYDTSGTGSGKVG